MVKLLNFFHRREYIGLLRFLINTVYFMKGYGFVKCRFRREFNAYELRVENKVFLTPGPGWVYSLAYLQNIVISSFCYYYKPKKGDCVVDLGAGLGEESLVFANLVGDSGRVLAVEASPRVFKSLEYICTSNDYGSIIPVNVALFEKDCLVDIEDNSDNYLINTINSQKGNSVSRVRGVTLDTLIKENNLNRIDFLKVNIEGAEQFLLSGSSNSLKLIENACISCHDFRHVNNGESSFYVTKEKVKSFLLNNGFEVFTRNTGDVVIDDFLYVRSRR